MSTDLRNPDPADRKHSLVTARREPDSHRLYLEWSDGAQATVPYDVLQGFCPCAACRGHDGGEIVYLEPERPVRSIEVAPVGNYAIHIAFEPGCNAGIFGFDYLRALCRRRELLAVPS